MDCLPDSTQVGLMAAGSVRVPPLLYQQLGLLPFPIPRVHHIQSRQQLGLDQGHCAAAGLRLLRVWSLTVCPVMVSLVMH